MGADRGVRWNHNIHYHRLVLDAIPDHARTALDVGTGDGLLAAELRDRPLGVTAIDVDGDVLDRASAQVDGVQWVHGDVMTYSFGRQFDAVVSVATSHHLPDTRAALRRFAELTAPGGVVAIVGLARTTRPSEVGMHLAGQVQHRWLSWRRGYWEHSAPTVWPPRDSYRDVRRVADDELPGVCWRLLPMWRYALVWRKLTY